MSFKAATNNAQGNVAAPALMATPGRRQRPGSDLAAQCLDSAILLQNAYHHECYMLSLSPQSGADFRQSISTIKHMHACTGLKNQQCFI